MEGQELYNEMSDENFDIHAWINARLRESDSGEGPSEQEAASSLVMRLQMFQLELAQECETASVSAVSTIPKALREVEALRGQADALKVELQSFHASLGSIESSSARSVAALRELDALRGRMSTCSDALREAQRFLELSRDIEAVVNDSAADIKEVASRIAEVRSSLRLLHDVPELRDGGSRLRHYEQRLQVSLGPRLVDALRAQDAREVQELVPVFIDLNAKEALRKAYFDARTQELEEEMPTEVSAIYTLLLKRVVLSATELQWSSVLFGADRKHQAIIELSIHLLKNLVSPLVISLGNGLEYMATVIACVEAFSHECPEELRTAADLYAPVRHFRAQYGSLEKQEADRVLQPLLSASSVPLSFMDTVQRAQESSAAVFRAAYAALDRCRQMTEMRERDGLIAALSHMFTAYFRHLESVVATAARTRQSGASQGGGFTTDWSAVHDSVKLLRTSEQILLKLAALNEALQPESISQSHAESVVEAAKRLIVELLNAPIRRSLLTVPGLECWSMQALVDPDLPHLKPDPSEYITQVIEHVFALPHQLAEGEGEEFAEKYISLVTEAASALYVSSATAIPRLSKSGKEQLQVDLTAYSNLLAALGIQVPQSIMSLKKLLKATPKGLQHASQEAVNEMEMKLASQLLGKERK